MLEGLSRESVDLEGLANHRGSAFGRRASAQPTQINFEHALAIALLKIERDYAGPIIIEDESRLIGRCALPAALKDRLAQSPLVVIDASLQSRVTHTVENYILANFNELIGMATTREQAFERFSQSLRDGLDRIQKRLGGMKHKELSGLLKHALDAHAQGDDSLHEEWIRALLVSYYDPMYDHQLANRRQSVIFSGNREEVMGYLKELQNAQWGDRGISRPRTNAALNKQIDATKKTGTRPAFSVVDRSTPGYVARRRKLRRPPIKETRPPNKNRKN